MRSDLLHYKKLAGFNIYKVKVIKQIDKRKQNNAI